MMVEMKFIKTPKDFLLFLDKAAFLLPRLTGRIDRWTRVPPSLQIEPTNSCQLNCITCGRSASSRQVGFMDIDLFRRIVDDARESGVKRIQLYLMGEPLLHPKILEMITYIKTKNLAFHLTTNGMLLNEKFIDGILACGVTSADYVTVSILGFSKDIHEEIMRGVDHDRVFMNLNNFIERRNELKINGPIIETVFYLNSWNRHELAGFMDYWRNRVDHVIDGGEAVEAFSRSATLSKPRTHTCSLIWERMPVQWNGEVVLCGQDMDASFIIGDLRTQTIREVWLGEKLKSLKTLHKLGRFDDIPICRNCDW